MVDAYRSEQGQSYVFISLRKENFLSDRWFKGHKSGSERGCFKRCSESKKNCDRHERFWFS